VLPALEISHCQKTQAQPLNHASQPKREKKSSTRGKFFALRHANLRVSLQHILNCPALCFPAPGYFCWISISRATDGTDYGATVGLVRTNSLKERESKGRRERHLVWASNVSVSEWGVKILRFKSRWVFVFSEFFRVYSLECSVICIWGGKLSQETHSTLLYYQTIPSTASSHL
jgi:hypothetical protein